MQSPDRSSARFLGLLLFLTGLLVNATSLGYYLADDHQIGDPRARMAIHIAQGICLVLGAALVAGWRVPRWTALRGVAAGFLPVLVGLGTYGTARVKTNLFTPELERIQAQELERMLASESVHLKLTPRFKKLAKAAENLAVPGIDAMKIFAPEVTVVDLKGVRPEDSVHTLPTVGVAFEHWDLDAARVADRQDLDLMRPLLDRIDFFEHAKFGFVAGSFEGDDWSRWRVHGYFKGVAWLQSGERAQMKGDLEVLWAMDPGLDYRDKDHFNDPDSWHIKELRFQSFHLERTAATLFTSELDGAIPDPHALHEAKRNITRERIVEWLTADARGESWAPPDPYWDYRAAWALPSVSVVDIDGDGLDDFYKMAQYGKNQLFRNNGDGTFAEIAAEVGLDVEDHTNCAVFADFDNDGDPDCFLGRSLEPSQYLVNENGHFEDRSEELFGEGRCFFVTTASAADYDCDGLLDLYLGTYAAQITIRQLNQMRARGDKAHEKALLADFLPEDQARELYRLAVHGMENHIRDRVGPPNVLMHNEGGGRFRRADDAGLELYRNTFQATWADYDADGDPDLYVANDFAYNDLYRNDGGRFVDVSLETRSEDVGFGMGCSWGDVDRDGDQDLYVSNMYSKAGNRIVGSITGMDPRFKDMASGNSLLAWNGMAFDRISSKDESGMKVEIGGWSWGSQFLDVDNDGWLDIYTLNGYYTAPALYRDDVDL